uniref:Uncharacterized protein n=1 Tax=Romanomermis culicivorax TaxID=13658 RepID=A0A915INN3_ROMCU
MPLTGRFALCLSLKGHLYLPFLTERNGTHRRQLETFSLKIHFPSERIFSILRKTIYNSLQSNRTERKFPFRSVTFRRSIPSEKAKPNQVYKISISAYNEVDDGPALVKEFRTMDESRLNPVSTTNFCRFRRTTNVLQYGEMSKQVSRKQVETRQRTILLENLTPATEYGFNVKWRPDERSDFVYFSDYGYARTLGKAPEIPPIITQVVQNEDHTIDVFWLPVTETNQQLSCKYFGSVSRSVFLTTWHILDFEIRYTFDENDDVLEEWSRATVGANVTNFKIKDDLYGSTVRVKVRTLNEYGTSPWSREAKIHLKSLYNDNYLPSERHTQLRPDFFVDSGSNTASSLSDSPLWISPKDNPIEKQEGKDLSLSCAPKYANDKIADIVWTFPNGSIVPVSQGGNRRIYAQWSAFPRHLQLRFNNLQISDSNVYTCAAYVNKELVKQKVNLTVTASGYYGHVIYWHDHRMMQSSVKLISPVLQPSLSYQSCFTLWLYVAHHAKGKLAMYLVDASEPSKKISSYSSINLDQANFQHNWNLAKLQLKPVKLDFRIVIEISKGTYEKSFVALDDLRLLLKNCDSVDEADGGFVAETFYKKLPITEF